MILREKLLPYQILLGSASPRRQTLLSELDIAFRIPDIVKVNEVFPTDMPLEDVPIYLASLKARAYLPLLTPRDILITADTVVICDGILLGKPTNDSHAEEMLRFLSGRQHRVVTGVSLATRSSSQNFAVSTLVTFRVLHDDEISHYVEKYHPLDKAGAYGIQEWIGFIGIERIEGSYFNVMGLPVQRLYIELLNFVDTIK